MNERTEQLKAALNTELAREGKLQRAGMRKCVCLWIKKKEYEEDQPYSREEWEVEEETDEYFSLVSKYPEYFHTFFYTGDKVRAVLEAENGAVFVWDARRIRFIT